MAYTLLRLTPGGVVLCDYHLRRLGLGGSDPADGGDRPARAVFVRFAAEKSPGVWSVWVDEAGMLNTERRGETRLFDGMPAVYAPTPVGERRGTIPKPRSPGAYDVVRRDGQTTLLTSRDGREIYEACRAAVLGWDGARIVCVPDDRPRVWSTAETAVREHLSVREQPILSDSAMPLLLVNAVKGTCGITVPGRDAFPDAARLDIERLFARLTCCPTGRGAERPNHFNTGAPPP